MAIYMEKETTFLLKMGQNMDGLAQNYMVGRVSQNLPETRLFF